MWGKMLLDRGIADDLERARTLITRALDGFGEARIRERSEASRQPRSM